MECSLRNNWSMVKKQLTNASQDGIIYIKAYSAPSSQGRSVNIMIFRVCEKGEQMVYKQDVVWLVYDNWDDFHFKTTFDMYYSDRLGRKYDIGSVKIGRKGMERGKIKDEMFKEFIQLPENFFSLGQDESYYEHIAHLGVTVRRAILTALRDVAYNLNLLAAFEDETVMRKSLLRSYSTAEAALFTVRGQLHRMALGGAKQTKYRFSYTAPKEQNTLLPNELTLEFSVNPQSKPPTNVHVLIGRNGAGKTYLIRNMIRCIQCGKSSYGRFEYAVEDKTTPSAEFANILCVAFSPFDDFSSLGKEESFIPWSFIGLEQKSGDLRQSITKQFLDAFDDCLHGERKRMLWREAIRILQSDPLFKKVKIDTFMPDHAEDVDAEKLNEKKTGVMQVFGDLSSGHKVVLLTITSCVSKIVERSIVFVDEPENHLHPPLLSAFIRALSNLLTDCNGVAIVSTHSPVVLQEVPASCVWRLTRNDMYSKAERLPMQTFGATIGSLTNEVFRLGEIKTGFYQMLSEAVEQIDDYSSVIKEFDNQLGNEAQVLLWTLLALRKKQEGSK